MKLVTRDADYAVRALCYISKDKNDIVAVGNLVDVLGISKPFLRKILQVLNRGGLLKSYKGKGGGFSLAKEPDQISIFNIVEIFQGPFQLSEHTIHGEECPNICTCYLKGQIDGIESEVADKLKSITIKKLLEKGM